jgi:hypothetical protein
MAVSPAGLWAVDTAGQAAPVMSLAQAQTDTATGEAAKAADEKPTATAPASVEETTAKEEAEEKALPISLSVSYYLLSDYVWRGINLSEHETEKGERLNHQVATSVNWDTGTYGSFGFDTFFEWYADQKKLNPYGGQNLQEVDYVFHWDYTIEPIKTDASVGYSIYTYPNLSKLLRSDKSVGNNNDDHYHEWWFKLTNNDAWMWKWLLPNNEEGVLNPTYFFAQDFSVGCGHVWQEISFSHDFEVVKNLTVTPGYLIAIDGGLLRRYLNQPHPGHMRLAYDQWSLKTTYDLTSVLKLPKWAGTLSVSGLLYYNNALGNAAADSINDEFYGGMSVDWGWGG